jgi:F-type H+-transporting ATPase subunit a
VTLARRLPLFVLPLALALAAPGLALASKPKVDPTKEFLLHPYIRIKPFSWLDLSITKAVIYLLFAAAISVVAPILVIRGGLRQKPERAQAVVEIVYSFVESTIARATLPQKLFSTWFPYLAALFTFIWVSNLISYIPLPFDTEHKTHGVPGFTLYASTANLSVTLALTLITFFASHYVGIKNNGTGKYFKSMVWVPAAPAPVRPVIAALEVLSQLLRLVSLSVRLFANMLAGHLLILMSAALVIIIGHWYIGIITTPVGIFFYAFEFLLIASLQAFIFAILSGIYIGFAVEAPH